MKILGYVFEFTDVLSASLSSRREKRARGVHAPSEVSLSPVVMMKLLLWCPWSSQKLGAFWTSSTFPKAGK